MKKLLTLIAAFALFAGVSLFAGQPATAQNTTECTVSGQHGAIIDNGSSVSANFSISGPADCDETKVSLAVWVCTPAGCNADLQNQRFHGFVTGNYDYSDAQDRGYAHIASIGPVNLPTELRQGDGCQLQIDLVQGSERADPSHPYPDGPFYDGRRLLAHIVANPACDEEEPQMVTVCDTQTGNIVQITEAQLDANPSRYGSASPIHEACLPPAEVQVCNASTGQIITVSEDEEDNYLPVNAEECDAAGKVHVCNANTGKIITVDEDEAGNYLPVDHAKCDAPQTPPQTPTSTPTQLPNTGPASTLAALFGTGALGQGIRLWIASRRGLAGALLGN